MKDTEWSPPGVSLEVLRQEERKLKERLEVVQRILKALGVTVEGKPKRRPGRPRQSDSRLHQIADVLREAGQPLAALAIYEGLRHKDPALNWRNPAAVFRSYLQRQEEGKELVVRISRGHYGLKEWAKKAEPDEFSLKK